MEYRPLNITVISAKGIKDVHMFSRMNVYAEVSIAGYPKSTKSTFVDRDCGTHPKWNHRMEFIVDEPYARKPGLSLLFHLKSHSSFRGDKDIGSVTVPIHHLFHPDSYKQVRVVKYEVVMAGGKAKGSLKFSYNFGEKFMQSMSKQVSHQPVVAPAPAPYYPKDNKNSLDEPVLAYPPQYPLPPPPPHVAYPAAYPAQPSGYGGYYQPPPPRYGSYQQPSGYPAEQKHKKNNKMGMGLGLGAGLLGGLLLGEVASDVGDAAAYADGYGDAMGDMDGFDF